MILELNVVTDKIKATIHVPINKIDYAIKTKEYGPCIRINGMTFELDQVNYMKVLNAFKIKNLEELNGGKNE